MAGNVQFVWCASFLYHFVCDFSLCSSASERNIFWLGVVAVAFMALVSLPDVAVVAVAVVASDPAATPTTTSSSNIQGQQQYQPATLPRFNGTLKAACAGCLTAHPLV